jgi:hypothetical protein
MRTSFLLFLRGSNSRFALPRKRQGVVQRNESFVLSLAGAFLKTRSLPGVAIQGKREGRGTYWVPGIHWIHEISRSGRESFS